MLTIFRNLRSSVKGFSTLRGDEEEELLAAAVDAAEKATTEERLEEEIECDRDKKV